MIRKAPVVEAPVLQPAQTPVTTPVPASDNAELKIAAPQQITVGEEVDLDDPFFSRILHEWSHQLVEFIDKPGAASLAEINQPLAHDLDSFRDGDSLLPC
jgi:hypothetical protein